MIIHRSAAGDLRFRLRWLAVAAAPLVAVAALVAAPSASALTAGFTPPVRVLDHPWGRHKHGVRQPDQREH